MNTELLTRIVMTRDVLNGKPRIAGTRILVTQVLDMLAAGMSSEDIRSNAYFPELTDEDIRACIAYASSVIHDDIVIPLR